MERPDFLNFLPSYSHSHHRYYHCHSNIIINPINIYNTLLDHVFHVVTHQYSKTMNVDMYMYRPSNLEHGSRVRIPLKPEFFSGFSFAIA